MKRLTLNERRQQVRDTERILRARIGDPISRGARAGAVTARRLYVVEWYDEAAGVWLPTMIVGLTYRLAMAQARRIRDIQAVRYRVVRYEAATYL